MSVSEHIRFENHINVASPETIGDAENTTDLFDGNPYDDDFEKKLASTNLTTPHNCEHWKEDKLGEALDIVDKKLESKETTFPHFGNLGSNVTDGKHEKDMCTFSNNEIIAEPDKQADLKSKLEKKGRIVESDTNNNLQEALKNINSEKFEKDLPKQDIVFKSIVDANFDYGNGGGKQYFIPRAMELKKDGFLIKSDNDEILTLNENEIFISDIRESQIGKYNIHLDHRDLTDEEIDQLLYSTDEVSSNGLSDEFIDISEETLAYFDNNTISIDGITDSNDEISFSETGKKIYHEDYTKPLGNQEDSGGNISPDSWEKSEKLEDGKIYYQLSPIYRDGYQDTKSSYFTDEETVNSCRDKNGILSLSMLMQKLQIEAKKELIDNKDGSRRKEYVRNYVLTPYIYTKKREDI